MGPDDSLMLDRLRRAIADSPCAGPVADPAIDAAEEELGIRFPRSYRIFLRFFGSSWLTPYEIAGLGGGRHSDPEPPFWQHVVDTTMMLRRASRK